MGKTSLAELQEATMTFYDDWFTKKDRDSLRSAPRDDLSTGHKNNILSDVKVDLLPDFKHLASDEDMTVMIEGDLQDMHEKNLTDLSAATSGVSANTGLLNTNLARPAPAEDDSDVITAKGSIVADAHTDTGESELDDKEEEDEDEQPEPTKPIKADKTKPKNPPLSKRKAPKKLTAAEKRKADAAARKAAQAADRKPIPAPTPRRTRAQTSGPDSKLKPAQETSKPAPTNKDTKDAQADPKPEAEGSDEEEVQITGQANLTADQKLAHETKRHVAEMKFIADNAKKERNKHLTEIGDKKAEVEEERNAGQERRREIDELEDIIASTETCIRFMQRTVSDQFDEIRRGLARKRRMFDYDGRDD